jgi:AraC-like DNA-binding protein
MIFGYTEIISIAVVGFFFFISILLIAFRRADIELLTFAFLCLTLATVLAIRTLTNTTWFYEVMSLLIWPCFYLFSVVHDNRNGIPLNYLLHYIIPVIWVLSRTIIPQEMRSGIFDGLYLLQFLVYAGLSLSELSKTLKSHRNRGAFKAHYLKFLFLGLIVLVITRFTLPVIFYQPVQVVDLFHLATALYLVIVSGFFINRPILPTNQNGDSYQSHELANYEEQMKRKLKLVMNDNKAYLNPDLTLNDLAVLAEVKIPELSGFINANLGKNFNDYINDYRVDEFKKLVKSKSTDPRATIMELAYESGFNSKASFNRIFKEHTGITPTEYRREAKSSPDML